VARNSEIRNIQISGCDIEANMSPGGPPAANVLFDTRAGSIREGAITGCTIQHGHETKDGANIRFIGQRATNPLAVGNFAIADNALSDVSVNIHLRHTRGVTIVGNTLWKGYQQNLLVEGSSNIIVGPNNFDRNPDYGAPDSADSVVFTDSSESTISGLHSNGARAEAAITLRRCRMFNISGCTILNPSGIGLLLEDVNRVRVSGCLIQSDQPKPAPAIRLTAGRDNLITGNLVNAALDIASGAAQVSGER
jgi:polygalacturonase